MRTFLYQHEIHLLKKTYKSFQTDQIAENFLSKVFNVYPFLEHELLLDRLNLGSSIMSVVELVIHSFEETKNGQFVIRKEIAIPLRNSVRSYEKYGIRREYYIMAGKVMIETIKEENQHLNSAAIQYWKYFIDLTVSTMIDQKFEGRFSSRILSTKKRFRFFVEKVKNYLSD